jgi:hypothetical protein
MPKLITLNWRDKDQGRDMFQAIEPNAAAQYVLHEGAEEWDRQNKAMEGYAKKYGLVELDSDKENAKDYLPKSKTTDPVEAAKQVDELTKQNAALLKRLEALEALRGKKDREDK